ncbi:MAG TPA: GNAT family N-acetyltransferase, partial [Rhodothermia bacterium]|nr:GNAT family N-acetyltransferase [Rhodothermia bacterium]
MTRTFVIRTPRLSLIPATPALARAEINDREEFARLLSASVPDNWPPESAVDALPIFLTWMEAAPDQTGWFAWYALASEDHSTHRVLVAGAGFKGPPRDGTVEVGYSVLPQFQNRGFAREMVTGLVRWALDQPGVTCVRAETEWENPASQRVLAKAGFSRIGPSTSVGSWFEFMAGVTSL